MTCITCNRLITERDAYVEIGYRDPNNPHPNGSISISEDYYHLDCAPRITPR